MLTITGDDAVTTFDCHACGQSAMTTDTGVTLHLDNAGDVDHDTDADHVALDPAEVALIVPAPALPPVVNAGILSTTWASAHPSWREAVEHAYDYLTRTGCDLERITPVEPVEVVTVHGKAVMAWETWGTTWDGHNRRFLRMGARVLDDRDDAPTPQEGV